MYFEKFCRVSKILGVMVPLLGTTFGATASQAQEGFATGSVDSLASFDLATVRGAVFPRHSAEISNRITSSIIRMPFDEGDQFFQGDLLVAFDCDYQEAEMEISRARLAKATLKHESNVELAKFGNIGSFELGISEADVFEVQAELKSRANDFDQCHLLAPFDGQVAQKHSNLYESPSVGSPLLRIISIEEHEIQMIIDSTWLRWLSTGTKFVIELDELGVQMTGKIIRVNTEVDAVSQTVKAIGKLDRQNATVLVGMSGGVVFPDNKN